MVLYSGGGDFLFIFIFFFILEYEGGILMGEILFFGMYWILLFIFIIMFS